MEDGRLDPRFLKCNYCDKVWDKRRAKRESIIEPLGSKSGIGEPTFEIASPSRRLRINRGNYDEFRVEDYPLAGEIDKDLQYFASQGFITSIIDVGNDPE